MWQTGTNNMSSCVNLRNNKWETTKKYWVPNITKKNMIVLWATLIGNLVEQERSFIKDMVFEGRIWLTSSHLVKIYHVGQQLPISCRETQTPGNSFESLLWDCFLYMCLLSFPHYSVISWRTPSPTSLGDQVLITTLF